MKFLGQGFQTLKHNNKTDTQTDATELITALHLRLVMKRNGWDKTSWVMTIAILAVISYSRPTLLVSGYLHDFQSHRCRVESPTR